MKNKLPLLILTVLTAIGIATGCHRNQRKIADMNPAFGKYIAAYTSGNISRKSTIRIELTESVLGKQDSSKTGTALPDPALLNDILSFEPELTGKAIWLSDRAIEFVPDSAMKPNQLYEAEFALGKLVAVESKLEEFTFQFSTYPQNLYVNVSGLRAYDNEKIEKQKLIGTLTTSDFESLKNVSQLIRVEQNGNTIPVVVTQGAANQFVFSADSIERKIKAGLVTVSWNGEPIGAKTKGTHEIKVPALGDFYVTNVNLSSGDDQYIELTFSDAILPSQNLKGIITLSGVEGLTYRIESNLVTVFLHNQLSGEKTLHVSTGIKNYRGYKMNNPYNVSLKFEDAKPTVRIKDKGCILPNSCGLIFPFEAIGLKAVDVRVVRIAENNVHQFLQVNMLGEGNELYRVGKVVAEKKIQLDYNKAINLKQWNTHVIDLKNLISPEPGAIYRVSIKFGKDDAICNCDSITSQTSSDDSADDDYDYTYESITNAGNTENDDWNERNWSYAFDNGYQTWDYYENSNPCSPHYYYGKAVSRNILASDLGIIYKEEANHTVHTFVSNLVTAQAMNGVKVEFYDFTRQQIASGNTDAHGMLELKLNRKPFLLIARMGTQRGYLKLLDGNALSLSKFDVEGQVVQKGVKGFIYGERGVWRPGDTLFLNFVLEDKQKNLPDNHPVKFELLDPSGQIIHTSTKIQNTGGIYDLKAVTSAEAPTGNYTARVKLGNRVFNETVKIETVKPNRLKINLDFSNTENKANLSARWLHGALAKNLKANVYVSMNQTDTRFDKYSNYVFDSPLRTYNTETELLFEGELNETGETSIGTKTVEPGLAPGMLRANYVTKVFEESGDFSIDRFAFNYSPYENYVGLLVPESKDRYYNCLETGTNYNFHVVSLSKLGKPVNAELEVKVYNLQWRWWYEKSDENMADFISRNSTTLVHSSKLTTKNGTGTFVFGVNYPKYGRYLITVTDTKGGHQTGKVVTIDWPYWSRSNRSDNENATMLNFATDKANYTTGQTIKLTIPSSAGGMALISVENGSRILSKTWIPTKKGETVHQLEATANMAPNAYVHVTLVQPHNSTKNDLPIRMYGVVPVMVDDPQTHLNPIIAMPDVIKPESVVPIAVKEKSGRKMHYTLALVDEGLLDLTRFKTPQPWNSFYAREALGVKTWDLYDDVIGAFAGKMDQLLSLGGDGDAGAGKSVKANRFKPVVKFLGPYTLEAGSEKTHRLAIPNYVGSVRVMVVAANEGAYGSTEKTVAVRKPLMLLGTLPRTLGPAEEVQLPVTLFAMEKHITNVDVQVQVNGLLNLEGAAKQHVKFQKPGEQVLNFKLKVAPQTGIARVKITATSGSEVAVQEIELDVRASSPKVTESKDFVLEPGKELSAEILLKGMKGTNKVTVEFSDLPAMNLQSRLTYLVQYPHGCIEQTTSSVFPQLFLSNLLQLDNGMKQQIQSNIKSGISRLQFFQTSTGGFAYWPGESYDCEWGSNYAAHFLFEAEKQGYSIPSSMKSRLLNYLRNTSKNWNSSRSAQNNYDYEHIAQAYRLYVLALSGNPELGAMNRLREEKNLPINSRWRLAAAYALAGQKEVAEKLVYNIGYIVKPYRELSYSYGSEFRDESMMLETMLLLNHKTTALYLARSLSKKLNSDQWYSTHETAYCLMALCKLSVVSGSRGLQLAWSHNGAAAQQVKSPKSMYQVNLNENTIGVKNTLQVKNQSNGSLFVKVIAVGQPLTGDNTSSAQDVRLDVTYKTMTGEHLDPSRIVQGTDFIAEVTISNPGTRGMLKEMALSQIFPAGWEIHNTRLFSDTYTSQARYQDIKDDRIYSYYDLASHQSKTIAVQLNATFLGRFYLPNVYTEAMYDNTIYAKTPGRWVEVVKQSKDLTTR